MRMKRSYMEAGPCSKPLYAGIRCVQVGLLQAAANHAESSAHMMRASEALPLRWRSPTTAFCCHSDAVISSWCPPASSSSPLPAACQGPPLHQSSAQEGEREGARRSPLWEQASGAALASNEAPALQASTDQARRHANPHAC